MTTIRLEDLVITGSVDTRDDSLTLPMPNKKLDPGAH